MQNEIATMRGRQATVLSSVPRLPTDAKASEAGGETDVVVFVLVVPELPPLPLVLLLAACIWAFRLPIFCSSAAMICWPSGVLPDEHDVQSPS